MNTLLLDIQHLMQTLQLDTNERQAWTQLLPIMTENELLNLKNNLQSQLKSMTDIYLTALANR